MGIGKRLLEAPPTTKVMIASNFMGTLLLTIGMFTKYWLQLDNTGRQGLWYFCNESTFYECCATIQAYVNNTSQTIPAFILATRAFITLGFICMIVADITFIAAFAKPALTDKRGFRIFLKAVHFFAGLDILLGVSIYGGDFTNHNLTKNYNLHASFGVCVAASFFFFATGVIMLLADISDESDES